jgi:hypothetical protein
LNVFQNHLGAPLYIKRFSAVSRTSAHEGRGGHGLRDHKVTKQTNYLPSSLINLYLKVPKKCSFVLFEQYVKKKKRYLKVWRCKMFGFFQKVQRTGAFLRTGGFP